MHKILIPLAVAQLTAATCGPEAQPQTFTLTVENVSPTYELSSSGVVNTPLASPDAGPLRPGAVYAFHFSAPRGAHLSFASMFGQSNDVFVAPAGGGIALFDADGQPRQGDVTRELLLWDAGTERDQPPGEGSNQAPRQPAPNTGPDDPNPRVRRVPDGGAYPAVPDMLAAILVHEGDNAFILKLINVAGPGTLTASDGSDVPVVFSPAAFAVHPDGDEPIFTEGQPDRGEGLEGLAEDGDPGALAATLAGRAGLNVPLSPGVLVTHDAGYEPLFTYGQPDRGEGLEYIAEMGDPTTLADNLASDGFVWEIHVFNTPDGAADPGPIRSGGSYSITFDAVPGEAVSLATMFGTSNDGFYAGPAEGIELFDPHGDPISGDITGAFSLWDAGTEANQMPGTGPDQPGNGGAMTGDPDPDDAVRFMDDGYAYPDLADVLKVTLHVR